MGISSVTADSSSHLARERFLGVCAWSVHGYTALGAVAGLFAIVYAAQGDFRAAFLAMAIAVAIDASDGTLARAFNVRQRTPVFDGALLDNVVDYLTFVVAPVFLMLRAWILPTGWPGLGVASLVMLASAYGFCRVDAKTDDNYFLGFPSYWNLAALYLYCFGLSTTANAVIVAAFAAMVFVPIKYIYPSRTQPLRPLTMVLGFIWGALTVALVLALPATPRVLLWGSFGYVVYYFSASFALHARTLIARTSSQTDVPS